MKDKKNNAGATENKQKQESLLVTKESLMAVFALFSILALLILCTDSLIFGEIGEIVHNFLLGTFGYFAFPIFLGALYLSLTSFLDKRLIKNRLIFSMILVASICLLLVIQTAVTYSWENSGYAVACFNAGESFSTATLLGWAGGLIISLFSTMMTKIGAMILFSLISLALIYFIAVNLKGGKLFVIKNKEPKKVADKPLENKQNAVNPTVAMQNASQNAVSSQSVYPPMQREGEPGMPYAYTTQRPQFMIDEENANYMQNNAVEEVVKTANRSSGAYSPFGAFGQNAYQGQQPPTSIGNSTPSIGRDELLVPDVKRFRENLIFDRNSKANTRPPANPYQPAYNQTPNVSQNEQTNLNEGFSSYTQSFESGLNLEDRPQKIVENPTPIDRRGYSLNVNTPTNPKNTQNDTFNVERDRSENLFNHNAETSPFASRNTGFERPMERESNSFEQKPFDRGDRLFDDTEKTERQTPSFNIPEEPKGDFTDRTGNGERSEGLNYRGLFSMSNPNIFGRNDSSRLNETQETEFSQGREISRPVDDEKEDKYSLNIAEERGREIEPTERFERESNFNETEGRVEFSRETRESRIETVNERENDALNIFDDEEESVEREDYTPVRETPTREINAIKFKKEPMEEKREEPIQPTVAKPTKPRYIRPYQSAPMHYFDCTEVKPDLDPDEVERTKEEILAVYRDRGITDLTFASVTFGPTVTRYNIMAPRTITPNRLVTSDIESSMAMVLRSKEVGIFPNFDAGVISIEVPNRKRQIVRLGSMLTGADYINAKPTSLVFAMGNDISNNKVYGDICKMTHLLVAGSTGSGKSVFLTTLIISLIQHYSPEQLRLILIDPKSTEFVIYHDLPHLMINDIITDPRKAVQSLGWAVGEMNRRYELFAQKSRAGTHVVNIDEYNASLEADEEKLPKIVIVIDELADLMLSAKKDVEERIQNLTQKSRAAGIHMVIATQRPSVNVITGVIKANLPTRIAFMVATDTDSRVILDVTGAQRLLGNGDMLYSMSGKAPIRVQNAYSDSAENQKVVDFIRENNDAYYDEEASMYINNSRPSDGDGFDFSGGEVEQVYIDALRLVMQSGSASISMVQRKCFVGYSKAGKIIEWMEAMGYISPFDGAKSRKVLITKEVFESNYGPF